MRVSVVVPTYRRMDLLGRCLTALARQRLPREEYEVVVADDAADEQTRDQVRKLAAGGMPLVYVPVAGSHGPAAARNAGWRTARGDIIAFTDDDCIPDSCWLTEGIKAFADREVIAATGQTIVPLPMAPTDYELNTANLEHCEFITANCFVRRDALQAVAGFDERFTTAWREDSDLHFRLLDDGGVIRNVPTAVVVHPARSARFGACLGEQRKVRFDALLFRKHPRHFRERIRPLWPWHYYVIVVSAAAAVVAALLGQWWLATTALLVWLVFTLRFVARRLQKTTHSLRHVAEMIVTSLAIPFLSIFWRLYGAVRFRVLFW